ncbi:hypothetical protein B7463_g3545, partial [Scytalidium lignicola]
MSRHKNVKNLDLDDELDDYDGGDDNDYGYDGDDVGGGEELSEEDQGQRDKLLEAGSRLLTVYTEQMRLGTIKTRAALPPGSGNITDKQIQEALWHYYYDIEKSVTYLVNTYLPKAQKITKKSGVKKEQVFELEISQLAICMKPFSFVNFFQDTPWLKVPKERQAVFIEPLYPRGGLLGGSPDNAPKMSKLQALAAARKKKAQEQNSNSRPSTEDSTASRAHDNGNVGESQMLKTSATVPQKSALRAFPVRKAQKEIPQSNIASRQESPPRVDETSKQEAGSIESKSILETKPSAFANIILGGEERASQHLQSDNIFILPFTVNTAISITDAFTGPSPDDIVIAAQSKASGKGAKGPPKTNGTKSDQVVNGMEAMKIESTPKATSKNLDVLAEYKKARSKNAANFVVIGHVDAGKSTLMGRLLYDLGVVDQRTIDKYRKDAEKMGKSSFALAWVLDQGTEERSRGVTIDIATNKFETKKTTFTILDAPGHRDFIPNMIAGTSQADFAVLVIDASTGSFESGLRGQTKEHALLARSLGVQRIIVAINKLDIVNWSKDRFDEISQQISAFLTTAGFQPKNISFVPCSGLNGDNITKKSTEAAASWYTGPTLVEELDKSEPITRALNKPLRLTIGDIFRGGVQNPLSISGRIEAGSLQTGDALLVQPSNQKCFIKSLEADNDTVDWAVAGQNVTIHLTDIDPIYLKVGDVLCSPTNPITNIKEFSAKVLAFEFLTPMQVDVHRGRLHTAGKIKEIVALLDKGNGQVTKKRPKIVKPGTVARVVVELDVSVPLEAPARVVLRSNGETVAAGLLE